MYIPMIFFSIRIEKRVLSPEEAEARYQQEQFIREWEEKRLLQAAQFPEYCRW
ncbi:YrzI family small protein [Brevibacillus borstelensis]|uniref:YrzI family small protein n=1 Tax=Brevibacillus borstelensis TaxID=45462 RepID=UPI0030C57379